MTCANDVCVSWLAQNWGWLVIGFVVWFVSAGITIGLITHDSGPRPSRVISIPLILFAPYSWVVAMLVIFALWLLSIPWRFCCWVWESVKIYLGLVKYVPPPDEDDDQEPW